MACTSQSALNYVTNARVHLVRELRNLSVIVENLYQQRVFSDEEVSKIQTERDDYDKTRRILDSVTKQGEAACYQLLRIIDMTRKRTVGRTPPVPENKTGASPGTKKFDLHHWISCFSFKEDTQMDVDNLQGPRPCHRYQAKLKSEVKEISKEFWKASKNLFEENRKPDLSYTSLVLDTQESPSPSKIKKCKSKKSKMSRTKKLKTYFPENKPEISPTDLLKRDENVLLVGKPGIGKTTLVGEMLRLWSEKDNKELDYMFYFDMRETSQITAATTLEELLFSVFSEPDEGVDEVLQDIKSNSQNVTIIFDGVTDLSSSVVQKLVKKKLLPYAKIILTCRPDDEEDFFCEDCLRVEVKGFSEQTIKSYLSAMLGEAQKVLNNLELLTLCHVPMYALMVAACFSSEDVQPCTITEIYIDIVRYCLQVNSSRTKNKDLNAFINTKREEILSLAEIAFLATQGKTVNLNEVSCKDSCVLCFLKPLFIKVGRTDTETRHAFLHYTLQEFFAAVWLLKNPDEIRNVFQQSLTEEKKHMKHLIPFMCGLLNDKSPRLMKHLMPAEELNKTSDWFFKELITTFVPGLCQPDVVDAENIGLNVDVMFLYQCLYESQCPEACIYLLDKLDHHVDLSGESLDPHSCCAVAYVVSQSKERKTRLNLEDVTISEQGMRSLFGCLHKVQWCDPLPRQLWKIFLLSEEQMDYTTLLGLDENQVHLPVEGEKQLFERAVEVMKRTTTKVRVCLYWDREAPVCQSLCESLLEVLPFINSLSFRTTYRDLGLWNQEEHHGTLEKQQKRLLLDLWLKAALHNEKSFRNIGNMLLSLFPDQTETSNILLDLYQHVRNEGFLSVIPKLRPLFQSGPEVWSIDLSERKTSILLEVLKLQSEKKEVNLTGWSHEESEVRSFLQCLPYISQLSVVSQVSRPSEETRFLGNLFCAAAEREQQTGEKILELLLSVCTYKTIPIKQKWCDFLLDLRSFVAETDLRVLPSLQSVFQSGPAVWSIDLSERKTSMLLEMLKLQSEKKQVELTGSSHVENEVRSLLQCLPYISQLSLVPQLSEPSGETSFLGNLFCAAAEREQQTGEKILELLSSVCNDETQPFSDLYNYSFDDDNVEEVCHALQDLFSHVKDCETKTGLRVLPSLQSVFQSAHPVWIINLSERKTSILLEVLKLQSEKKQVKLTGWSDEESEVRSFLQYLPYISHLSCDPDLFQRVCSSISVRSSQEVQQLVSLLKLLDFKLLLTGKLSRKTCCSVGRVLQLCGSEVDLSLTAKKMSVRRASLLFTNTTHLHSLRLSNAMVLFLVQWIRRGRPSLPMTLEKLSLEPQTSQPSDRLLLKVVSSLASLLRSCSVRQLDLTESCIPVQHLIPLLLHDGPPTLKLSGDSLHQLLVLLHEVQDQDLTLSSLRKVSGDLTSCSLNWDLLHYLLQHSPSQTFTVNLRKNRSLEENAARLLPFLDRIVFKRPRPSFVMTSIRELYRVQASHMVPSLLRSLDHVINLSCRELDSVDSAALLFTLRHSDGVKVDLRWTSIPEEATRSILSTLDRVSQLSVDRKLLLRLIHGCAASDGQQEASSVLLRTLQQRLDLSCGSCVDLPEEDQTEPLSLTADDCRAASIVLKHCSRVTQLHLQDCEVEDAGLDLLFCVLDRVRLRVSKSVLLQLLSLLPVHSERDTVRRAQSLCGALGGELDLSHSTLDQRVCGGLVQMLDSCEGLTELDLSHCGLSDQLLLPLITHLHKVQVLDLSHNKITDASTDVLLQLLSIHSSIHTVRLFGNDVVDRRPFEKLKRVEMW